MNIEKFVKSPYRALVMVIITFLLGFLGYHNIMHIIGGLPDKKEAITMGHIWLIPAIILAYVWSSATIVSFLMIFLNRPPKPYKEKGLIWGLILGLIWSLIWILIFGLIWGLILGLIWSLIWILIWSLILGLIWAVLILGLVNEFLKPYQKPTDATDTSAADVS